jgi:hypothetical protein
MVLRTTERRIFKFKFANDRHGKPVVSNDDFKRLCVGWTLVFGMSCPEDLFECGPEPNRPTPSIVHKIQNSSRENVQHFKSEPPASAGGRDLASLTFSAYKFQAGLYGRRER